MPVPALKAAGAVALVEVQVVGAGAAGDDVGVAVAVEVAGGEDGVHAGPVVGEVDAGAGLEAAGVRCPGRGTGRGAGAAGDDVGVAVAVEVAGGQDGVHAGPVVGEVGTGAGLESAGALPW